MAIQGSTAYLTGGCKLATPGPGLRNVSLELRNVSFRLRNVSLELRNVSFRLRNVGCADGGAAGVRGRGSAAGDRWRGAGQACTSGFAVLYRPVVDECANPWRA